MSSGEPEATDFVPILYEFAALCMGEAKQIGRRIVRREQELRVTMMASENNKKPAADGKDGKGAIRAEPEWADGLKQLYDSVVDEPLPASFRDLLAKLDDRDDK